MTPTVLRNIAVTVEGDELVALGLAVELGCELLGRNLCQQGFALVNLVHVDVVAFHWVFCNSIIEYRHFNLGIDDSRFQYLPEKCRSN